VGGWLAGALARAEEDVVVLARGSTASLIRERGLRIESATHGSYEARPEAAERLDSPVDALFVATKATGLEAALERVQPAAPSVVLPLLNGLDHMAVLRERFGPKVAAAVIRIESDAPEPGHIVQSSPSASIAMASDGEVPRARLEEVAAALERAEVPAEVGSSEGAVLWGKLVRLNAIALTTAAADAPMGVVRADPHWRAKLVACVEEASEVAAAEGVEIRAERVIGELEGIHDSLTSSLQRDVNRGNPSELEHIPGGILRAGARHGIACPTIESLVAEIKEARGIEP
jgi:2-dehydropantoate 2-reductase